MTVRECYTKMAGDYDGVLIRLGNEDRLKRFLLKMADEPTFAALERSLQAGDQQGAFRAAHTLKGVALNLGLTPLADASSRLTEALREGGPLTDAAGLFQHVQRAYTAVQEAIQALSDGLGDDEDGGGK